MTLVRMLQSLAGPDHSLDPGTPVETDAAVAEAWIAAGIAQPANKRQVAADDIVQYTPPKARMVPPIGLLDPLSLPDGKQRALAEVVASVAKRNELDMAAWNNLGNGQKRELIDREIAEMRRKLDDAKARPHERAELVEG